MRDILKNFPTENVEIYDESGIKIKEVEGLFGKTGLTITDTTTPLIEGQFVFRKLPNGNIEKYEIVESKYIKGHGDICDFYKLSLSKNTAKTNIQKGNIYNDYSIHIGDNNKIDDSIIGNNNE